MALNFVKMHGCGNDFIMIDDRSGVWQNKWSLLTKKIAAPHLGLGADGVIFICDPQKHEDISHKTDFSMIYVNADGEIGEMCGNGARCAVAFADQLGLVSGGQTNFFTGAGLIAAEITDNIVSIKMTKPHGLREKITIDILDHPYLFDYIDTGVPHVAALTHRIEEIDIVPIGKLVRHHDEFSPRGTNVNFYEIRGKNHLRVRTYERGVENETLACGTGSVACALIAHHHGHVGPGPVRIDTTSGVPVFIDFHPIGPGDYTDVTLSGPTMVVARGQIDAGWLAANHLNPI